MATRVAVSDHAVLRFLERVEGVDVRALKRRIRNAATNAARLRASGVTVDGVHFALCYDKDGTPVVVTAHSDHPRPHLAQARLGKPERIGLMQVDWDA